MATTANPTGRLRCPWCAVPIAMRCESCPRCGVPLAEAAVAAAPAGHVVVLHAAPGPTVGGSILGRPLRSASPVARAGTLRALAAVLGVVGALAIAAALTAGLSVSGPETAADRAAGAKAVAAVRGAPTDGVEVVEADGDRWAAVRSASGTCVGATGRLDAVGVRVQALEGECSPGRARQVIPPISGR